MTDERLKHVAEIRISSVDKKSVPGDAPVKLCNYTDVYYNERITGALEFMAATATQEQRRTFGLLPGDVLLTKDSETADDIGASALVTDNVLGLVCGYHLAIVRPHKDRVLGPYLRWVLSSTKVRQQLASLATGVTRFGLRQESIADLRIPIPSVEAQRAIADYLDRETERIDLLLDRKREMLKLLTERWRAVLGKVIWDGVRKTAPVMHFVESGRPIMYGIVLPGPDVGGDGIPIVKGGDVVNRRLSSDGLARTTPEIEKPYARARLRGGDILYAIRGGVGDVAIAPDALAGANITQDVARIAPRKDVRSDWLKFALQSPRAQADAESRITGATIRGLNIWELERLRLPMASPERQEDDLRRLTMEDLRLRGLRSGLTRQLQLLTERRTSLISASVTGRLPIAGVA